MGTPAANRKRAARRAARKETPNVEAEAQAPEGTGEAPVLTPLEQDAINIANAVQLVRGSYSVSADVALKIVDLTLTARMQALALKAERGMPFPFATEDAPTAPEEGVEGDGAEPQVDAPLTEVEAPNDES